MTEGSKKTLFLTGASGFIGKNIIEQLGGKYQIIAPTRSELELLDENKVKIFFDHNQIDVVIHGAVRPGHRNAKDLSHQLDHNLRMFFNLAGQKDKFRKLIFLNSGLAYGLEHYQPKMKEEYFNTHVPEDEAGLSKHTVSQQIEKTDKMIDLRLFGVFGKYEDYAIRFISNLICKAIFGLPLTMKQNRRFDYLYIDDLMPVLEYFIENQPGHKSFNITPDQSIELYALAEKIKALSGRGLEIKIGKEGMGPEYSGDNGRLHKEIKNLKFTPIDEAIKQLYKWYRENKNSIRKELLLTDK